MLAQWVAGMDPARAQPTVAAAATESAVKAAFLYKFASFVEWPPGIFRRPDQALVIAVLGDDDVASDLEQLVAGRAVDGHAVVVRRLEAVSANDVHVLYIGTRREPRLRDAISAAQGPVLVVTDQAAGLRMGSVINFSAEAGRLRFSVSLSSAQARNLRLSSRLLAVAQDIEGRPR